MGSLHSNSSRAARSGEFELKEITCDTGYGSSVSGSVSAFEKGELFFEKTKIYSLSPRQDSRFVIEGPILKRRKSHNTL